MALHTSGKWTKEWEKRCRGGWPQQKVGHPTAKPQTWLARLGGRQWQTRYQAQELPAPGVSLCEKASWGAGEGDDERGRCYLRRLL